jgi:hypothetical protein
LECTVNKSENLIYEYEATCTIAGALAKEWIWTQNGVNIYRDEKSEAIKGERGSDFYFNRSGPVFDVIVAIAITDIGEIRSEKLYVGSGAGMFQIL